MLEKAKIQLIEQAVNSLSQCETGAYPSGNNGPHQDGETPVRTTAHVLYMLCYLVEIGKVQYRCKAIKAADYLISNEARPMDAAFYCRLNPNKDFCNGLIGQAWVMESLIKASITLEDPKYRDTALSVFLQHSWSEELSAWKSLNVDGSNGPVFRTFNQQLWMAYIGLLLNDSLTKSRSKDWVDNVLEHMDIYFDGVIFHDSIAFKEEKLSVINNIRRFKFNLTYKKKEMTRQRKRSVGYHSFNLVPIAYVYKVFPNHRFFDSAKFKSILKSLNTKSYINDLENNPFSYAYNPVGYELMYFNEMFNVNQEFNYLDRQIEHVKMSNSRIEIVDSLDPVNSIARTYELCREF